MNRIVLSSDEKEAQLYLHLLRKFPAYVQNSEQHGYD